ncbi:hypothetical protein conserved [Leishmania donovani]|uniref:Uncharacterized protein n=3 Tax=Leishmania donovani species complex TaxID=38574 RepID=A4I8X7_LEIIN|nr:conserved hypothetical protein [Leishmania infantum JPCM5]CAC9531378.1 hypothetical_protein_-_conserved [Leishmania infantum]CAJ1992096.1 hypothetical protein conserved [Leishmania donovani]CAM71277.1 conserved hypothetical protein [Leishmania infantum JPCM5]SUZ45120.1 hypothetical_protein_-_conserved [Leishmania infantum]VDZ47933.1 hypothetical_protein_conserved [Leishmania donovani]|eukprot:XP_001468196.1 conserved hypothetical protein [Leishmania infantum JPCM5]
MSTPGTNSSASAKASSPIVHRDRRGASAGDGKPLSANDPPQQSAAFGSVSPLPPKLSTAASAATTASAPASPSPEMDNLECQSKDFLIQRVQALERQLKIRNSDCARLLEERQQLLPLKEKCESQREMILALRDQLNLAQAQHESVIDALEEMKRQQRDKEHRERVAHAERVIYGASAAPKATAGGTNRPETSSSPATNAAPSYKPASALRANNPARRAPGGTVVNTSSGPQIIYDSSDISSVGFTKNAKLPYDFLGGPGAQLQYLAPSRGSAGKEAGEQPEGGFDASDDAQVRRTMAAAAEAIELDAKHAEMEEKEHRALLERLKALREGHK